MEFLIFLNKQTESFVLKGGTALLACYNLDRFSEDIDLDGKGKNIAGIVSKFCNRKGYSYRVAKDTETVKRCFIHYADDSKPLKIEVSLRKRDIKADEINVINGIAVYNIDTLCMMKTNAYVHRDKIRDLYDIAFIYNNYENELSPMVVSNLQNALEYKGIEQFDYVINNQNDELIDNQKLADDFLTMFENLGLLATDEELQILKSAKQEAKQKKKPKDRDER